MKKRKGFFLLLIVTVLAVGLSACGSGITSDDTPYKQVSTDEAIHMMKESTDYIILDVRTKEEYDSGHIEHAVNLANEEIDESTSTATLPQKDQKIFVYCRSGNRSKQASKKLAELGYTKIIEFGGINQWTGKIVSE